MHSYRTCATAAGADVNPAAPHHLHRFASCEACDGLGYVRPNGTTYVNARQAAQARRRGTSATAAAVPCGCCDGAAAHRIA